MKFLKKLWKRFSDYVENEKPKTDEELEWNAGAP